MKRALPEQKAGGCVKLLLMPNLDKKNVIECVQQVCKLLSPKAELWMADIRREHFFDCEGLQFGNFDDLLSRCDFCIAIGGDGTIIHAAKHAVQKDKPVLGINLGRLGFLATLETGELKLLNKLETGDYVVEKRMMLSVVHRGREGEQTYHALNDVVLSKGALARMIDLNISCQGKGVGAYRADGIIFSTPTGSTAYNLSAGGPVIDPTIDCITLTPVAPHSPFGRTIIFNEQSVILVTPARPEQEIFLTVDGEQGIPIQMGDEVLISKSETSVKLINLTGKLFYQVLNDKLLYGSEWQTRPTGKEKEI